MGMNLIFFFYSQYKSLTRLRFITPSLNKGLFVNNILLIAMWLSSEALVGTDAFPSDTGYRGVPYNKFRRIITKPIGNDLQFVIVVMGERN